MLEKKVELTGCWKSSETAAVNRLTDSGGPRSTHTKENVDLVNDLVLSQEDTLQTHRTVRENLIISWVATKLPPWVC